MHTPKVARQKFRISFKVTQSRESLHMILTNSLKTRWLCSIRQFAWIALKAVFKKRNLLEWGRRSVWTSEFETFKCVRSLSIKIRTFQWNLIVICQWSPSESFENTVQCCSTSLLICSKLKEAQTMSIRQLPHNPAHYYHSLWFQESQLLDFSMRSLKLSFRSWSARADLPQIDRSSGW